MLFGLASSWSPFSPPPPSPPSLPLSLARPQAHFQPLTALLLPGGETLLGLCTDLCAFPHISLSSYPQLLNMLVVLNKQHFKRF